MSTQLAPSFGVKTTPQNVGYSDILRVWKEADATEEIEHAWLWDHMLPLRGDPTVPVPDGWSLLAALAGQTRRLRMGLIVTNNLTRHPAVLAKMAATVDQISGGRLDLGLGAGGNTPDESAAYGLPEPGAGERIARLAEACEIITRMWTEGPFDFKGRYYNLTGAVCEPKPTRQPAPPLMIGGVGEKSLLRVAARYAGIWNMPGPPHYSAEAFRRKSALLDQHCAEVGRDPKEIVRSVQTHVHYDDLAITRDAVRELIDAGVQHLVLNVPPPYPESIVRRLVDEVIAPARELA